MQMCSVVISQLELYLSSKTAANCNRLGVYRQAINQTSNVLQSLCRVTLWATII